MVKQSSGKSSSRMYFGILLIAVGFFLLAKEMGWISMRLPIWPLLLIILGFYLLLSKKQ